MKQFLTFALLLSVYVTSAQIIVSTSTAPMSADQKAVSDLERRRFDAQVKKDYVVLEQIMADDLIYTHSNGPVDNKTGYIQSIRDGKLTYDAIDVQEETIRVYGNTAVVNGVCLIRATSNGEIINTRIRYTDVYVRKSQQWQMVAYQSLRLGN